MKRRDERAYTNDEIAEHEHLAAEIRAKLDDYQPERMRAALAALRGSAQQAVQGKLPAAAEIQQLIAEFEAPDWDTKKAFASHRRAWIVACLRAALTSTEPQTVQVTEALQLAKNIIFGAKHQADRERNYAKSAEYQSLIDDLDAGLSSLTEGDQRTATHALLMNAVAASGTVAYDLPTSASVVEALEPFAKLAGQYDSYSERSGCYPTTLLVSDLRKARAALTAARDTEGKESPANAIISQIEERFPDWKSYRDLLDCIDCTLHRLREAQS